MTPARYREFLIRIYGLEAPLESAFTLVPRLGEWVAGARDRLALLVDDLRALGLPAACLLELPRCGIAPFRGLAGALGWAYVLEANATNRQILARLIGPHALPTAYLASHDRPASGLVDRVEQPTDATSIVDAALEAYDCQHRWLGPAQRCHTNVAIRR